MVKIERKQMGFGPGTEMSSSTKQYLVNFRNSDVTVEFFKWVSPKIKSSEGMSIRE